MDVDEHVLDGALPQVPHTGHTVQRASMMRFGPVDGETTHHIIRDLRSIHLHLHGRELTVQGDFGLRGRDLTRQHCGPVTSEVDNLVIIR